MFFLKNPGYSTLFNLAIITVLFFATSLKAQQSFFGDMPVNWQNNKPYVIPAAYENHLKSDLVILEDDVQLYFYAINNERVVRDIVIRINNKSGLDALQNYKLPESFDAGYDGGLFKQGRQSKIKTPFITEYQVKKLAARKFSSGRWTTVEFKYKYETVRRIKSSGEFGNEDLSCFQFLNLNVGDVVEIYYESDFNSNYGSNLFYFNSAYPKLKVQFDFTYKVNKRYAEYAFMLPVNIHDSCISRTIVDLKDDVLRTDKIKLANLKGINYAANSFEGAINPHVFADFRFFRVVNNSYPVDGGRIYDIELIRPRNFEWIVLSDTINNYTKVYDKQFSALRKFLGTMSPTGTDSSNMVFFKALCDTFNNFRYISANHLFYKESNLYDVYSADHLLKRRLTEISIPKIYQDILNESKTFYYDANLQDKRFGEHSVSKRAHYAYENRLIAVPNKNSYVYFMPRYMGIKYHMNELPFYFENSLAALTPRNFQDQTKNKESKFFKFIKTHSGTFNENTRTENATVKISVDSLKAGFTIKESLSGQFSTVLRHLYLNEFIDSTISPYYFKKCTEKPGASQVKIKLSSSISEFPFRYTFNCSEKLALAGKQNLDLHNWFSFLISKQSLPEVPTHDYYFDFDFSDSYNFLLDFDAPVDITNAAAFSNNLNNGYFELESAVIKNSESSYLLKVKLLVKQRKLPLEEMQLLSDLLTMLESLNDFSLALAKK